MAGVAFLIKHDTAFRRIFLQNICGVSEPDLKHQFEVQVQPASHADLRLRCAETRAVYIVEFKLGAHLQSKQDPTNDNAFFKSGSGYGWSIASAYPECEQRTYIVVQNWRTFQDGRSRNIVVLSRAWKDLIDRPMKESLLARDLLDTLGAWGVAALRFRHQIFMKKANHTQDAAEMFQIVIAIAEEQGIKPKDYDFDVQPGDESGASWFGLNVPFGLKRFTRLEKIAVQAEGSLGWFGYGSGDGPATLDVWIYCKPSKATVTPLAKTLEFVRKRLGTTFGGTIVEADGSIRISVPGDTVSDDKQWFASVFDALQDGVA